MKVLWRITKEAKKYRLLYFAAISGTLLMTLVNLVAPKLMSNMVSIVSDGVEKSELNMIFLLAAALFLIYLARIGLRFCSSYLSHKAAWTLVQEMRMRLYNKLQSFSAAFYHDKQTGDLMSRVITDTETFEQLFAHIIPESVTNVITLVGVTVILFFTNVKLALFTCIPIPFIVIASRIFIKKVRPNFRISQRAKGEFAAQIQDNFSGIHEIQAFAQEKAASERVEQKASNVTSRVLYALKRSAVYHPTVEFLTSLGTVIVVGFGGYLSFVNSIDVADIVAFMLYLSLFYAPITSIANLLENAQQALAGAERVVEMLDTPETVLDAPDASELEEVEGSIVFDHVSFGYSKEIPVLRDISFEVKPGQMIALVGATGVGKTTLSQLIARFYDPTEGRILIDGKDISRVTLNSLRSNISMVLQDTFLFNGTVCENIAFSRPDATFEEIVEAAKAANIHDDIMAMPQGYDTLIGERGTKLSGGQKQRMAIARAVLCRSKILILDEATASVDVETEANIQTAINSLSGSRTVIAIAHRLSTIRKADIILVFENGRIVQRGTHDELVAADGIYRNMCKVQEQGATI